MNPSKVLLEVFGYEFFRPLQKEIIDHVLEKNDALVIIPTGGGKSVCYQIPALLNEGFALVVSPLIALMKDQVDGLKANGVKAEFINSSQTQAQQKQIIEQVNRGEVKILYMAPERIMGSGGRFIEYLRDRPVSLIAIDEAHCISQWGHDFRPEYLELARLKESLPEVPVLALTATADALTQKDIKEKLTISEAKTFISSFNRPNIHYLVRPKRNTFAQLVEFLEKYKEDTGIIYTLSRASTEELADALNSEGFEAVAYHAGLEQEQRVKRQEMFQHDKIKIVVATIAFGMGIDKSNVRYVVHMDLPKNVEGYYQETGRAGRDGLDSEALLFYSYGDVIRLSSFIFNNTEPEYTKILKEKLNQMAEYGSTQTCRRKYLLNYFGEEAPHQCGNCDICLTDFEQFDGTEIAQKALSAVARLGQSYGVGYTVDFLRGSNSKKILASHKQLKTYGVGSDLKVDEWKEYFEDLLRQGYLAQSEGTYSVLKFTEKSEGILRGVEKVMLRKVTSTREVEVPQQVDYEKPLFEELRSWRFNEATKANLPPYVILSDASLKDLSTQLPLVKEDLTFINGFGSVKISRHGEDVIKIIQAYCKENQLESRLVRRHTRKKSGSTTLKGGTAKVSYTLFKEGKDVEEIANERNLARSTIYGHLQKYVISGEIQAEELVEGDKIPIIREVILQVGKDKGLNPIKSELGDEFTYEDIRIVLAGMQRGKA